MTTTVTARGPEDLLAVVPVVLGFSPEESLVMLTFGATSTFHARVDLPTPDEEQEGAVVDIVAALLGPCLLHEVQRVVFLVYTGDVGLAARLASELVPAFVAEGICVIGVIRAHDRRWCSVPVRAGARESRAVPYDERSHPVRAQAVVEGWVTHGSREELRASLAPDPGLRDRWAGLVASQSALGPVDPGLLRQLVATWVATGRDPEGADAAQVLRSVSRVEVRDAAVFAVTRDTARDHLRVWSCLLRGAPDEAVPDVAALVAFCAWLVGHGALAWCALDRCFAVAPAHLLGTCVAECLERAIPPTRWEETAVT